MCKFFIYIIHNKSSCTKIGGAVARAVLELGRNKEQLNPLNKKIAHISSAINSRRNVGRASGSIVVVSRYYWSAQPDCDLQEMVCIRVWRCAMQRNIARKNVLFMYK